MSTYEPEWTGWRKVFEKNINASYLSVSRNTFAWLAIFCINAELLWHSLIVESAGSVHMSTPLGFSNKQTTFIEFCKWKLFVDFVLLKCKWQTNQVQKLALFERERFSLMNLISQHSFQEQRNRLVHPNPPSKPLYNIILSKMSICILINFQTENCCISACNKNG